MLWKDTCISMRTFTTLGVLYFITQSSTTKQHIAFTKYITPHIKVQCSVQCDLTYDTMFTIFFLIMPGKGDCSIDFFSPKKKTVLEHFFFLKGKKGSIDC